jgi:hypothetical protein
MATLVGERTTTFRFSQFGGGYGHPGLKQTHPHNLVPVENGFTSIHCSLARAAGGGDAAVGIMAGVHNERGEFFIESWADWPAVLYTQAPRFTLAAFAKGAALTAICRIQFWQW